MIKILIIDFDELFSVSFNAVVEPLKNSSKSEDESVALKEYLRQDVYNSLINLHDRRFSYCTCFFKIFILEFYFII